MNETLAYRVLKAVIEAGIREFCLCPGARNSPLVASLVKEKQIHPYFWFEERSCAFFALGKAKKSACPVAIITTSGTAVGELLPALMEAYYACVPLVVITADRPKKMRGTGAPQACEQVGIFGKYVSFDLDLSDDDSVDFSDWDRKGSLHLNVCFDEPLNEDFDLKPLLDENEAPLVWTSPKISENPLNRAMLDQFFHQCKHPLIIVGALDKDDQEQVSQFLQQTCAPCYIESLSGLRENRLLKKQQILSPDRLLFRAAQSGYPIDGVLRIGGVPTVRLWRDLEEKPGQIKVLSIDRRPFSGISWGKLIHTQISDFFSSYNSSRTYEGEALSDWIQNENMLYQSMIKRVDEEPNSEPALIYQLSKLIPERSLIYLGNSLPIRHWELAADRTDRGQIIRASRGLNGIDGQLSCFLGLCQKGIENWAILGDLTLLYDMAAPWILEIMKDYCIRIVVINNQGGRIFQRKFTHPCFQCRHRLDFESFAGMWNLKYEKWYEIPETFRSDLPTLLELVPNEEQTERFFDTWR